MKKVTISEMKTNLSKYVASVADHQEPYVISGLLQLFQAAPDSA